MVKVLLLASAHRVVSEKQCGIPLHHPLDRPPHVHPRIHAETPFEVAAGRVPVVAGTGSNSTREAIALTQHAEQAGQEAYKAMIKAAKALVLIQYDDVTDEDPDEVVDEFKERFYDTKRIFDQFFINVFLNPHLPY